MAITKKKNKFSVPKEYNESIIFARGGQLFDNKGNIFATGADLNLLQNIKSGNIQTSLGQGLGVAQGTMQLGSQIGSNFDTSGIGSEVMGVNDISRNDILNTNINVDSKQTNVGGQALSGAVSGASAGMQFGGLPGAAIGAGVGLLSGGISSIIGNNSKQLAAQQAEQDWTNNLQAKNRQFQGQDLRNNMANFNAFGGSLNSVQGMDINKNLTSFNTGGSHESNPNSGIMQGTGNNGQPNLVEQGETKHEDYVFSDRLKVNPQITKEFKLPTGLNGKTFAAASKYLSREGKDRPNDPISNNGIKAQLAKLTTAQEGLKQQMQPQQQQDIPMGGQQMDNSGQINQQSQQFASGGKVFKMNEPISGSENVYNRDNKTTHDFNILDQFGPKYANYYTNLKYNNSPTEEFFNHPHVFNELIHRPDVGVPDTTYNFRGNNMPFTEIYNSQTKGNDKLEYNAVRDLFEKQVEGLQNKPKNKFANGGQIDQTHYRNPTLQGENIGAMGGNLYGLGDDLTAFRRSDTGYKYKNYDLTNANDTTLAAALKHAKSRGYNPAGYQQSFQLDYLQPNNPIGLNINPLQTESNASVVSKLNNIQTGSYGTLDNQSNNNQGFDFSRYAPVAANMVMGISDMFQQPEVVKYGRVNPERVTAHMDYQPIDTEWMNNKMNSNYASTRDQVVNQAGGNRSMAMSGLSGVNQQQQNAIGESYLRAQDMNYQRRNQALQFNTGIEQQNVSAQNAAQQQNLQLQMQELDANARNRAAKRNAARQAILNAAGNVGQIGTENWASKTGAAMTGYKTDPGSGQVTYIRNQDGSFTPIKKS